MGTVAHACHPSSWEVEAEGLNVQGQPCLNEFSVNLDYMKAYVRKKFERIILNYSTAKIMYQ